MPTPRNPTSTEKAQTLALQKGTYMPPRSIRVMDAHRYKDPEDARYYGEQVEIELRHMELGQSQAFTMSDNEALDLAIRLLTYLRDKAEGITP